jgi:hypothetical protein
MKRVLLDENLDWRLKNYFSPEFDVTSVPDLGCQSKKNGELLSAMDAEGIVYLLTADRNLRYQQNLDKYSVIIVVLSAFDNRLKSMTPFISEIEAEILAAEPVQRSSRSPSK